MKDILHKYIEVYGLTRTPRTTLRVQYQLGYFEKYVAEKHKVYSIHQLEITHVLGWSTELKKTLSPSTLPSYLFALSGFCKWLYKEEYLPFSLWPEGLDVKQPKYLPKVVPSVQEVAQHLDNIPWEKRFPYRNRAILELAYSTGLRQAELASLNIDQFQGEWLEVLGKGNKARRVPLGSKTRQALIRYIKSDREKLVKKNKQNKREVALFLNQYGRRLGGASFNNIVHNTRPSGNLSLKKRKYTLHSFRHACATHMLENGANIRTLQKLLGHSKISSTEVYTNVSTISLKEKLWETHPRG
jgi:integrase/recombinase XerD